jgi:uncharacterized membrane protein YqjE
MDVKETLFKFLHLDNLVGNLTGYLETRLELYKVEMREDFARVLARAMVYIMLSLFGFLFLIFLSIGVANFINSFYDAAYVGYWIVAGVYALGFLLFLLFRKSIDKIIEQRFMEMIKRRMK